MGFTVKQFAWNHLVPGEGINYTFNREEFSLFVGVTILAFEGIGLTIPIQESMIRPNDFPKVLFMVIITISTIFSFIGSLGYLTFGQDIETIIMLNLPQNSPAVIMIQLLYAIAILLSMPIQIFPAVRLIELKLFRSSQSGVAEEPLKNLVFDGHQRHQILRWQKPRQVCFICGLLRLHSLGVHVPAHAPLEELL